MIKAILVDDEAIVRLTLSSIVDWDELGIQIVGSYGNGKQVLSHIERNDDVDLIITDINMPILGGLELIQILQDSGRTIEFLVISAYDDYQLVREAFKLGITDYILKQNISEATLTALITTIVGRIDLSERSPLADAYKRLEEDVHRVFYGQAGSLPEVFGKAKSVSQYLVGLICVEDYKELVKHYGTDIQKSFILPLKQTIMQIESPKHQFCLVNHDPNEFALVIMSEKEDEGVTLDLAAIFARINTQLRTFMNVESTITLSELSRDPSELREKYAEAKYLKRYKFIYDKNTIIEPSVEQEMESLWLEYKKDFIQPILTKGIKGDKKAVLEYIDRMGELLGHGDARDNYSQCVFVCLAVICEYGLYLESIHDDMVTVFGKQVDYGRRLKGFTGIAELQRFMKNWLGWLMDYMANQSVRVESSVITKSKAYIEAKYSDPNLTLVEVSDSLGFSQKHFSSLFSKEVGITYSEFLTELRIHKAKELMIQSNKKIYEIGQEVGYKNTEHFSRVFKKRTGFSPNDYRHIEI